MNICNFIYLLSITLIGTFVGFFLALYANRKLKSNEDIKQKQSHLYYLKGVLEALIKYIPTQLKSYTEFSLQVRNAPLEFHKPEINATFDLLRFRNADNVETQKAYFYFFRNDENQYTNYKILFGQGDYLFLEFELMQSSILKANENKLKDQNFIWEVVCEISLLLGMRQVSLENTLGNDFQNNSEYKFIDNLAIVYNNIIQEFVVFQKVKDDFITPLFKNILTQIKEKDLAQQLFKLARQADRKLKSIEKNELFFIKEIEQFCKKMEKPLQILKDESIKLNNIT